MSTVNFCKVFRKHCFFISIKFFRRRQSVLNVSVVCCQLLYGLNKLANELSLKNKIEKKLDLETLANNNLETILTKNFGE